MCKFLFNLQHVKKAGHECVRVCECVCGCVCLCMHIINAFLARSDTESETKQYKTEQNRTELNGREENKPLLVARVFVLLLYPAVI